MNQYLGLVSLLVREYDEAIEFFVGKLGFELVEDRHIPEEDKRWVVVKPAGSQRGAELLLARASSQQQRERIGTQTGGRVFLFLYTDDCWRDHNDYRSRGVKFARDPANLPHGVAAVFEDLYGNLWDLVQLKSEAASDSPAGLGPQPPDKPNQIPVGTRVVNVLMSAALLGYGTFGVLRNDLYLPSRSGLGAHLHGLTMWLVYGAMLCGVANLISVVVDHYDLRPNESDYRKFAFFTQVLGWALALAALLNQIASKSALQP